MFPRLTITATAEINRAFETLLNCRAVNNPLSIVFITKPKTFQSVGLFRESESMLKAFVTPNSRMNPGYGGG